MKKIFILFLALVTNVGIIYASNIEVDGIWYDFDASNKTATVTYRGNYVNSYPNEYSGSIVIPASLTYNGTTYSVTSIGDYAFYDCSSLTSVTIPNSVTSIGSYAFYKCPSLTSVTINSDAIVNKAYNYSSHLSNIFGSQVTEYIIGDNVKGIGNYAFYDCSGLTSVTIPNSVTRIGGAAFYDCSGLTSVTISNSVTSIGDYAFYDCLSLTSVTIPNSVTSIGNFAFYGCSGLTSPVYNAHCFAYMPTSYSGAYTIPEGIKQIAGAAFNGCSSLTSITIPNSVTSIGDYAFYGTGIYANEDNWENNVLNINDCLISAKESISGAYTIKAGTRLIADHAFEGCSSLTSITIPNSVTSIANAAFQGCKSLTSINVDSNNLNYSSVDGVLFNKDKTTLIAYPGGKQGAYTIPNSVTSIGNYAFDHCSSLTSVTIPNSVTSIGNYTFSWCSSLTSVTIGNSVTSIGSSAFYKCSSLTSITIPNSVTSIGDYAFDGCKSLTSITIPNSVTSIGSYAFSYCKSLTSITIPNSVTSIGEWAFSFCSSLTSINIPNSVTSIGSRAFVGCSSLTSITIPNSVTSIGIRAFDECSSLSSITIPNSVTSIGELAFWDCKSLTSVTNYATQPQAIETTVFQDVDISACQLHVPSTSVDLYKTAKVWKDFGNIQPIRAEDITDVSETIITPSENEVEITWPSVSGAATYELVIKDKDGNIVCTLIFNANGQLTSIAFNAPSRNGAPAQTQSAGFSFTITGLDSGTGYDLTLTAKDNSGNTIQTETISFVTTSPQGIEDIPSSSLQGGDRGRLILRDGQVLILRNGKTYTMQGQEVK